MTPISSSVRVARRLLVRGVVQGVGFRPHVYRLATAHTLDGWVLNADDGVEIHVEGPAEAIDEFVREVAANAPPAARIATFDVESCDLETQKSGFEIRDSAFDHRPTTRVSPDLPVCEDCLRELFDPRDRRCRYPYINCTNCGPRFSIVRALPYDRARTTMAGWPLCAVCAAQYRDAADRRFHAQPVACATCGPRYRLVWGHDHVVRGDDAVVLAARLLHQGSIVAVKGIGGYHLACDADNADVVLALREGKYRKEQAFALMVRDIDVAEDTVRLCDAARTLLTSAARPIVLAPARVALTGVAPDNHDLGA